MNTCIMATSQDQIVQTPVKDTPENRDDMEDEAIKLALEASSSSENESDVNDDAFTPPITVSDKKKKRAESRRKSLDPNR